MSGGDEADPRALLGLGASVLASGDQRIGRRKKILFGCSLGFGAFVAVALAGTVVLSLFFTVTKDGGGHGSVPDFGYPMRRRWFFIPDKLVVLNHGSYGALTKPVMEAEREYMLAMETNTDEWFRRTLPPLLDDTRKAVANYVAADPRNVVILENASGGVNAVLRSLKFNRGNKVLQLSIAYGMVKKTLEFLVDRWGIEVVTVVIGLPATRQKVLDEVTTAFDQHNFTFAVFDHISSVPALILPVEELIQLSRARGVPHLIDGAHAVGQVPLNLTNMDPDFYLSNGHKWLCSPKGGAFLYVREALQPSIHPTTISHDYGNGYRQEFAWTGTKDFSAYLSLRDAINLRHTLTDSKVYGYNNKLCTDAVQLLVKLWGTDSPADADMQASLANIRLPCDGGDESPPQCEYSWKLNDVQEQLRDEGYWVVLYEVDGVRYTRISCQIYNVLKEYEKFGKRLLEITASSGTASRSNLDTAVIL